MQRLRSSLASQQAGYDWMLFITCQAPARVATQKAPLQIEDVSAAGVVLTPFVALYVLLLVTRPPTSVQLAAADPLIQLPFVALGHAGIPLLSLGVIAAWCWAVRPSAAALRRAVSLALLALLFVAVAVPLARLVLGPTLPAFVPPEESARPGMLGLGAGILEETLFRLVLFPALLWGASRALPRHFAAATAMVLTGFSFAFLHEVGPGARPFELPYFLDRAVFAGLTSALALWPGFSFVVAAHCGAHVLLPLLFR